MKILKSWSYFWHIIMAENFDIWNFRLSDAEMSEIDTLDLGHSEIIDHFSPKTAKWLNGWKIHE